VLLFSNTAHPVNQPLPYSPSTRGGVDRGEYSGWSDSLPKETSDLNLKEKRRTIDRLDRQLVILLNQRLRVALQVGKIKKRMGEKIYDPSREKEILTRLEVKNRGPLTNQDLIKIFRMIIKICRASQT